MNFFRNVTGLLATSSVTMPVGMVTGIVLTRFLTPEDRGLWAVAVTFAGIGTLLFKMGLPSASVYRLRRVGSEPRKVMGAALGLTLLASAAAAAGSLAAKDWILARFLDDAPTTVFYLALAMIPLTLLRGIFTSIARALDRFRIPNLNGIWNSVAMLAATSAVLIWMQGALVEALVANVAVQLLFILLLAVPVLRLTGLALRWDFQETRGSLRFGLKSYLQALAGQVHERVDIFMLAYLLPDPALVAHYAVAAGVIQRLKTLPEAISAAAFPQLAGYGDREAAEFACRISRQSFGWTLLTAAALAAAAPILIPLVYGSEYEASVLPFLVLIPGMTVFTIYRVFSRYFMAVDRQQANIYTQTASVLVNVTLNLLLIPRYGVLGAAIASLFSYTMEAVLIAGLFKAASGRRLSDMFVLKRSDLADYRRRLAPVLQRLGIKR